MTVDERKLMEARYKLFEHFALEDQRKYYKRAVYKSRQSAMQVNRLRAFFALLAGLASALAGTLVAMYNASGGLSGEVQTLVGLLTIVAVVAPALGAAFTTLADLYQWDRLITVYDAALENLEVADAQSPRDDMDDSLVYRASLRAYTEGTLSVMRDETAQWGQLIKTPAQLEKFVEEEREKAERAANQVPPAGGGQKPSG